jgi:ribosomal protein S18 acetylase RimI-like enzyme
MPIQINELRPEDCEQFVALWRAASSGGTGGATGDVDQMVWGIREYLRKHPGLSLVAREAGTGAIVGVILCGHDRRKLRNHRLVIAESHRQSDVARRLLDNAVVKLRARGLRKCHVRVAGGASGAEGPDGVEAVETQAERAFWRGLRWTAADAE